jgi:hypothetical protein
MNEEADVRQLDVRDHPPAAELAGRCDREAHELGAQVVGTEPRQYSQPIALPLLTRRLERVQADGPARLAVDQPDCVQRLVLVIAIVAVVEREQSLLADEHRSAQREVCLQLLSG